jgi:uncharacterized protein involved in exopolysaccharide biosynthesis
MASYDDHTAAEQPTDDTLGWDQLFAALRRRAALMVALPIMVAALALAASYLVEPRYRVKAVLIPQQSNQQQGLLGSLAAQVGGMAALAGVDLGGSMNKFEAIEVLRSRSLAEEFINSRKLLPLLFPKDWDADRQQWKATDRDEVPSLADGVREFDRRVRAVAEDRRTGLVTLSIEWRDRKVAADWANDLIRRANARMQAREIDEARRTIEYLTRKASSEESVAVREGLYKIVESQYKSMALASVRQDFAFRVIDAASPPDADDIAVPRRAVYAAVGGFVGLLISGLLLLFEVRRRAKSRP